MPRTRCRSRLFGAFSPRGHSAMEDQTTVPVESDAAELDRASSPGERRKLDTRVTSVCAASPALKDLGGHRAGDEPQHPESRSDRGESAHFPALEVIPMPLQANTLILYDALAHPAVQLVGGRGASLRRARVS